MYAPFQFHASKKRHIITWHHLLNNTIKPFSHSSCKIDIHVKPLLFYFWCILVAYQCVLINSELVSLNQLISNSIVSKAGAIRCIASSQLSLTHRSILVLWLLYPHYWLIYTSTLRPTLLLCTLQTTQGCTAKLRKFLLEKVVQKRLFTTDEAL